MKIAIIGKMGSGKSTFATRLGKKLKIEVTHMDKIYHKIDWSHITREELVEKINQIIKKDEWIVDGNYQHTIDQRLNAADTIIFFDIPTVICLYRVFKRALIKNDKVKDKIEGLSDKVSWKLIQLIITYKRKEVLEKLRKLQSLKQIFIIKNEADARDILNKITADLRS